MKLTKLQKELLKKLSKDSTDYVNKLFFIENYVKVRRS